MYKLLGGILFLSYSISAHSQFFYKDIITNKQLATEMMTYKEKKIHTVTLKSYENDGSPSKGFFCDKKISKDFKSVELFTRSDISPTSLFTSVFNEKGNLLNSTDSSSISVTHNSYNYDDGGRIKKISSSVKSSDDDFTNEILEDHVYTYSETGVPLSMTIFKNRKDSTKILFSVDEKGNIALEKNTKDGSKYYYYYDTNNRLTDIAQSNEFREKMVAAYVFEYDENGLLNQMTTTEEGRGLERGDTHRTFYIWRYVNENGLRMKEGLFSENGKLMGSIEYEY